MKLRTLVILLAAVETAKNDIRYIKNRDPSLWPNWDSNADFHEANVEYKAKLAEAEQTLENLLNRILE